MYTTIDSIRAANKKAGRYWFTPDTMRFFSSRVHSAVYPVAHGAYFVTSETPDRYAEPRRYTVRFCDQTGGIGTVGEFRQYASASGAHARARREARNQAAAVAA